MTDNELIKALQYDRGQYEKGYKDGMEAATKWVSADVNLPDRPGEYLVFSGIVLVAWYRPGSGQWETPHGLTMGVEDKIITHWMPLPEAPETLKVVLPETLKTIDPKVFGENYPLEGESES